MGHDHRMAGVRGTARDNRTVIGVVADLPGWVEYLPRRRSGQETWRWPREREAVGFSPGRLLPEFASWLKRIAINAALDFLRKKRKFVAVPGRLQARGAGQSLHY